MVKNIILELLQEILLELQCHLSMILLFLMVVVGILMIMMDLLPLQFHLEMLQGRILFVLILVILTAGEPDLLEGDSLIQLWPNNRANRFRHHFIGVEQAEDPLGSGYRLLHYGNLFGHHMYRLEKHPD